MIGTSDPYDLNRFTSAQAGVIDQALTEIRSGRKKTHWMWFVFPQFIGLGSSAMAARYGITSVEEARAYVRHPILGPRLIECTQAVLDLSNLSAREIFGSPDDMKLRSCATLFAYVSPDVSVFHQLLDKCYKDEPDPATLTLLSDS
ncbi:MAG: DUF1810 domain-containing protein [Gemmatimonadales bacterium]